VKDNTTNVRYQVSRRTILRGAGVAMSLPWLESIPVWGSELQRDDAGDDADGGASFPKRFAALFMACGVNPDHWNAKQLDDGSLQLSKSLQPMTPYREHVNVVDGLFNKNATGVGIHPGQTGNILSGAALQKGAELRGSISIDQLLANRLGGDTAQPSLVLGCEQPITGYHETNFSMAYSSHISWQNATSPVPMEVYPSLAFDSLFDNQGTRRNRSVLDRIREEATSFAKDVNAADKAKLDEYLTSVREAEQRIERLRARQEKAAQRSKTTGTEPSKMDRPDNGLPEDIREHMRLMCDIVALGFQTDRSRVATLLLCRDISGLFYPFLDVRKAHHSASHDDRSDDFERVTSYYVSQMAYLTKRLAEMPEGNGTVLDNSFLMFVNNMWSGSRHDSSKVPLFTVGGLGGTVKTGRALDFSAAGDDNRKLCSLYLAVSQRMGCELKSFGDAEKTLDI
jgi:hypothetical protein